jgi:hypothetical protein
MSLAGGFSGIVSLIALQVSFLYSQPAYKWALSREVLKV